MAHEVRRTGDGSFYLVAVDEMGTSKEIYTDGKLLVFETSEDAKEHIKTYLEVKPAPKKVLFTRR